MGIGDRCTCSYITNVVERKSWEVQARISHKVAVMKAMLVVMIVNETLVDHWCDDEFEDVQIQGVVTDLDEMEFNFVDSRSAWVYESPDHVVDEVLTSRNPEKGLHAISAATVSGTSISAASVKIEPSRDEHVPPLPTALWLMDTGCGHDLINDRMTGDFTVRTLKKSSRIMFSTANGRIESHNVVPLYCSELAQLVHPYLLHDTPPVLSIGKRCMEQGFTFHWDPGRNPVMTNPEGMIVELEVEKNIPYLRAGSESSHPRPPRETKMVAIAPMVEQSGDSAPPPVTSRLAWQAKKWSCTRTMTRKRTMRSMKTSTPTPKNSML